MERTVTGIDVGTYHVKVVIAQAAENSREAPRILGTGYAESRGLKSGYIVSRGEVSRSIAAAVAQASRAARVKVRSAYLGIGGVGVGQMRKGKAKRDGAAKVIADLKPDWHKPGSKADLASLALKYGAKL